MADQADLNAFVNVEWDGDDLWVEVVTDDACRNCIAVEPAHEVEDGCAVGDPDLLLARKSREDLLGEIERVICALVEGEPWQVGKIGEGRTIADACRELGVTEQTYYRWRNQYGGMKADDAKRLKELEKQNATLKRLLAEAELEKAALKELAEGNF